ncbi:MAG: FAD-dependent oxidoreductase [Tepidanaerobacteraceae bacterium]|jgi:2,4-dienoyl-CoA reductase-like NADH-dependent reductase (Old Yellow Enzyme family)/thioredoxin reductase|nr:FAD-dependent oxidoreductase [Tepidanaerobacteraceae bacterium]
MLKYIFSPIKIGKMELSNRLVVPPMVMNYCNEDGTATERFIAYHEAKARGGWGLIITEDYAVDPRGKGFSRIPGLWDDSQIESHSRLTERIHKYGAKIVAQIYHCGRQTNHLVIGEQPVAPSPIPCPVNQEMPHELTVKEIKEVVEKFGDCAYRAKKAGFDGVEVHGAHGYLIAQFMSPYSNKRTDEYGGSLQNRLRFPLEIISNIKAKAGNDFPVIFRISADEFVPGGRTIEDTKAIAIILEDAGINAIHVSAGVYASADAIIPPSAVRHGWITDYAAEVKKVVSIPVITVGRINDPFVAEAIISSGKADLVSIGRGSLADPEMPNKAAAGKFEDIVQCIGCMQGCIERLFKNIDVKCLVNPSLGRELEFAIQKAGIKKKILVAGGGPAGMEAAIVAAKRGHEVHLYEKADILGGQYRLASVPPSKGEITTFITWQKKQLNKYGVIIHLNTELTAEIADEQKPDIVIIATGGKPFVPDIPGIDKPNVVAAHDVLSGKADVGPKVIIVGGGMIGSETANHLANHGKEVIIVEMLPQIAKDEEANVRMYLMKDLEEKKVVVYTNTIVKEIDDDGIKVERNGKTEKIGPADTIVLAVGVKPVNNLAEQLQNKVEKIITVGDAFEVRKALEAIEEGYKAGLEV